MRKSTRKKKGSEPVPDLESLLGESRRRLGIGTHNSTTVGHCSMRGAPVMSRYELTKKEPKTLFGNCVKTGSIVF